QTDELAVASAEGRFAAGLAELAGGPPEQTNVDDGAGAMVARERGLPNAALLERWRTGATTLREALAASDPHRRVEWVAGQISTRTLATTRLAECWIHTGDVADALGLAQEPTDRLEHIARLAWRTLPYAFARDGRRLTGPVSFDLRAPGGGRWQCVPDSEPVTVVEGDGADLCLVAARRVAAADTSLRARGPDGAAVLELVRTYA
ncbi:MAG TPA: maleylpyruvate isomerase family mycothiol-dependent enzyme, partial [Ilumatobacteraceae bacterium]|nr:maleylpyruvate isomerase family mycothiol-dependent enzyme [Ilumatobacteraceae bacterium]